MTSTTREWVIWLASFVVAFVIGFILAVAVASRVHSGVTRPYVPPLPPAVSIAPNTRLTTAQGVCSTSGTQCAQAAVQYMNTYRAQVGSPPLKLDWSLYPGKGTPYYGKCIGANGHVHHLVASITGFQDFGTFAHDQFPQEICGPYNTAGQNVGEYYGSKSSALQADLQDMMAEGHTPLGTCTQGHDCNITQRQFTRVGVAFAYSNALGGYLIVYDFVG